MSAAAAKVGCPRIPFIKNSLVLYTFELAGNLKKITDGCIPTQKKGLSHFVF